MTIMIMRGGFAITIFACAFALSGCGGSEEIVDIDHTRFIAEAEGWGYDWKSGTNKNSVSVNVKGHMFDDIDKVVVDGHTFDRECININDYHETSCKDSNGNKVEFTKLYMYDYLVVTKWIERGHTTAKKAYIIVDTFNRTPSHVKISGSYKGNAEILAGQTPDSAYYAIGDLKLNINNNKVSGSVQNFHLDPDGMNSPMKGRFDINGSVSGNRLSASFGGNLNGEEIVKSKSRMEGGFFGPKGEEVGGGLSSETKKGTLIRGVWYARK